MYIPMFNKSVSLPTLTYYIHAILSYFGKQSMLGTVFLTQVWHITLTSSLAVGQPFLV